MARILLLNGPNLNLLGIREPKIYGRGTLAELEDRLEEQARELGHELLSRQSNAEAELLGVVQRAPDELIDFILINPAALTHTSIALRDALTAVSLPFIEIHISNVYARETFRRCSYLSDVAVGTITGLGMHGYELALSAADRLIKMQ